jgi:hypothetical protein
MTIEAIEKKLKDLGAEDCTSADSEFLPLYCLHYVGYEIHVLLSSFECYVNLSTAGKYGKELRELRRGSNQEQTSLEFPHAFPIPENVLEVFNELSADILALELRTRTIIEFVWNP